MLFGGGFFMDKAIIVGTYEFIGFHLCLSLLEQGIEVIGIHLQTKGEDIFLEEKRLEIGRNDNFKEKDETYLVSLEQVSDDVVIFIDYYSYYFKKEESQLFSAFKTALLTSQLPRFVLLVPIQLCEEKTLKEQFPFGITEKRDDSVTTFYLPTVYGPWQPAKYAFQQFLIDPNKPVIVDDREWTADALYIDDTVDTILHHLESKEEKAYLLRSEINDHWEKVAAMLWGKSLVKPHGEKKNISQDILVLDTGVTEIETGIEKQKRHLRRLTERRY